MKIVLEIPDSLSQTIADAVVARLRPLLAPKKGEGEDAILTPDQLAGYLETTRGWVYEQTALSAIPHFKAGKLLRFRQSAIDKWVESQSVPASCPPNKRLRVAK